MKSYFISPRDIFSQALDEPVITSLLDIDVYKFPMGQLIWSREQWRNAKVKFSLIIRTPGLKLGNIIEMAALREQLEHVKKLKFTEAEIAYLRGMPMGNDKRMFIEPYLKFLKELSLPDFDLKIEKDGQIDLSFEGKWAEVTFWETIAMSIISETYYYGLHRKNPLKPYEFMATYAAKIKKLHEMIEMLRQEPSLTFSEFGTRRRHSKRWQQLVLSSFNDMLPEQCVGSSNVLLSMQEGSSNPKGTNAHELPMAVANLTEDTDEAIKQAQYTVVEEWYKMFPELSIILPDTFGTTQFLETAPAWMAEKCVGARIDSKDPEIATEEFISWWEKNGVDPQTKILIASDGLNAAKMLKLYQKFGNRVGNYTFGLGTMATNNCEGAWPQKQDPGLKPFSMVIKITEANGKSAIKLSDNPGKAMGDPARVERFKRIFGVAGMKEEKIKV